MHTIPDWYTDHLIAALENMLTLRRARELEREAADQIARLVIRETREKPTQEALAAVRRLGLLSR